MIHISDVNFSFGSQVLFQDVNVRFISGNCYGIIGANGAGKSTFLKLLSGDLDSNSGEVNVKSRSRISVLKQDQFAHEDVTVLNAVMMGHPELYAIMAEREILYAKADFTNEDGMRATELEGTFAEMDGYSADSNAASMLNELGISTDLHDRKMRDLDSAIKVRVLLAQAMFGDPDILLLDEPTNNLDVDSIAWLENYLQRLTSSLVIVVSHDRHFLNAVCTHIADIDYGKVRVYAGNYEFWYQSRELAIRQRRTLTKKNSDKAKELKAFISRFSSNASKARQATSRRKLLDKLTLDQLPISTRRYPHINFEPGRACGRSILSIENLSASFDGEKLFANVDLTLNKGDKIAIVGANSLAKSIFFEILAGKHKPDTGEFTWGSTITQGYFPKDNESFFDCDHNLVNWMRQYSEDQSEQYLRGFLGRMLFGGDEADKSTRVLSGGEKVRCMFSMIMQQNPNVLIMDEPTNHLDLESITALNNGLIKFPEVILFTSHDRELIESVATRILKLTVNGFEEQTLERVLGTTVEAERSHSISKKR